MKYYVLFYEVVYDYLSRRSTFRAEHLRYAQQAQQRDELILAGALSDRTIGPSSCSTRPPGLRSNIRPQYVTYVINGLVTRWEVRSGRSLSVMNRPERSRRGCKAIDGSDSHAYQGALRTRDPIEKNEG